MIVLLLPVVLNWPAPPPIKVLSLPDELKKPALLPKNELESPVVLSWPAAWPKKALPWPDKLDSPAPLPKMELKLPVLLIRPHNQRSYCQRRSRLSFRRDSQ